MAIRKKLKPDQRGLSYLEVIISVIIIGFVLISLMQLSSLTLRGVTEAKHEEIAIIMAREAMDALRSYRDNSDWTTNGLGTLSVGVPFHPAIQTLGATTSWAILAGAETQGAFTRTIVLSNVSRDPVTHNIEAVYNAARNDNSTRLATVTISRASKNYIYYAYFSDWH